MARAGQTLGLFLGVLGLFWAGRESDHGLSAFWEHWWCPLPLAAVLLGTLLALAGRFNRAAPR